MYPILTHVPNIYVAQYACEALLARLLPYKEARPEGTWEDWVSAAYFDRVSLSATGFYKQVQRSINVINNEKRYVLY